MDKLSYAASAKKSYERTVKERLVDALIGSALVIVGLFYCLLAISFTAGQSGCIDDVADRPLNMIPREIFRIFKGRDAAKN